MAELSVTDDQLSLLIEALDAYEYWQLGDGLPRHDGMVWTPGDALGSDRFWSRPPTDSEAERIAAVRKCRALAEAISTGDPGPAGQRRQG